MSTLTENYKLLKPSQTDFINIDDINNNFDIIDTTLSNKVDKISGKSLSTNDYTNEEKNKLNNLSNYTHPAVHLASMIVFSDGETLQQKFDNNTLFKSENEEPGEEEPGE